MDGNGFISKVRLDGSIENLEWVRNLNAPKGSALFGNKLYVTDINRVVVINVETGEIISEHSDPQAIFLNDVAVDHEGKVYISDYSGKNSIIYHLNQENLDIWVKGSEIDKPNGLYISGNELIVGNSGDGKIKAIHLEKKTIRTVSVVGSGIDGLKMDGEGNFIVSDWAGKTSWISKEGQVIELINTTQQKINAADLEFIVKKNLIIIPTFFDNRLVAYELLR
jgi:sugar lactone lactonase YvrE